MPRTLLGLSRPQMPGPEPVAIEGQMHNRRGYQPTLNLAKAMVLALVSLFFWVTGYALKGALRGGLAGLIIMIITALFRPWLYDLFEWPPQCFPLRLRWLYDPFGWPPPYFPLPV